MSDFETGGNNVNYLFSLMGMGFMHLGILIVIIGPVTGFFIIIIARFLAEQMRMFAALVNNTKEMATNIKK